MLHFYYLCVLSVLTNPCYLLRAGLGKAVWHNMGTGELQSTVSYTVI